MSSPLDLSPLPPASAPARSARPLLAVAVSAFFTVLLIWTEIWLAVGAVVWSLATFLHAGMSGYLLTGIVLAPPALWASWKSMLLAWAAESEND